MAKRRKIKNEFDPTKEMYVIEYFCTRVCNMQGEWVPSLVTQDKEVAENELLARSKLENAPTRMREI